MSDPGLRGLKPVPEHRRWKGFAVHRPKRRRGFSIPLALGAVLAAAILVLTVTGWPPSLANHAPNGPCASMSSQEHSKQGAWLEKLGATADPKISAAPDPLVAPGLVLVAFVTEPPGTGFSDMGVGWDSQRCTFQVLEPIITSKNLVATLGLTAGVSYDHTALKQLAQDYTFDSPSGGSDMLLDYGKAMALDGKLCASTAPPSFTFETVAGIADMATRLHMVCLSNR